MDNEFNLKDMLEKHTIERKEYVRKKRKDAGVKRDTYKAILPPKYRSYVFRSNAKGIPFKLTIEQFDAILAMPCTYCGKCPANTIDRIDSRDGYIEGNVTPACNQCNGMKWVASQESFIQQVKRIYDYSIKNKNISEDI